MEVEVEGRELRLTNLEKVLYPATGFTKGAVLDYYARVAGVLLPHVAGRPLTLRRLPDGTGVRAEFEKCCPEHRPDWLTVAVVPRVRGGEDMPFCVVDDLPSLMWSANLANLELHPMLARVPGLDAPTAVAFDLDPGPAAGLLEAAGIALLLRDVLAGIGLDSRAKTSGGKGMQVFVPLNTPVAYARTRAFARTVAELLAGRMPQRVTAVVARRERRGRVLVDWGQNAAHKSIVAPYSLRGRDRPVVSAPLHWDEVRAAVDAGDAAALEFEAGAMLERVEREGDVWAPVAELRQALPG